MAHPVNEARQKALDAKAALNKLQDEQSAAKASLSAFLRKQVDGSLTDDDKKAMAEAETKVAGFDARVSAARRLALLAEEDQAAAESKQADEMAALAKNPSGRVTVEKDRLDKMAEDPYRGFGRSPRGFLMAVVQNQGLRDRAQISDDRLKPLAVFDKDDKQAGGELAYLLPRGFTPRSLQAAAGSDEQGVYDDRYGGFAVETSRLPGVMGTTWEGDPTAGMTQAVPMQTPSVEIIARNDKDHTTSVSGGFTVSRRAETTAMVASRSSLEKITLKASSLFGHAFETEELLTDSPLSFVAIIEAGLRTQFGAHMLNEKLRGGGGNEYLGVLTALYSSTAADSKGPTISVAKESGQAADTIVGENAIKMAAQCWGFDQAVWMANHNARPQLYKLSIPVGVGGTLIYQPSREVGFPDMLLGRPIYYSEHMSKLGDLGDFGLFNWSQYLDGLYQPTQFAESVHVRFLTHERAFKAWLRNAGAPWWRTAMTPAKASEKLSPFVLLAERA